jgi:putative ABC transport system substrate-binding protein
MTKRFTRRKCIAAIGTAILPQHLNAQQSPAPIIGVLDSAAATAFKLSTFYEGLKVEGFSKNQNLTVEYHSAESDYARLPELAADLVNRRVTLITAFGDSAALAAKAATAKTPIVFAVNANPIEIGLVASLNHPGANLTGATGMAVGREQKRLELLHAAIPTALVFGFLLNPQYSNRDSQINDALAAAQKLGAQIKMSGRVRHVTLAMFLLSWPDRKQEVLSSLTMSFFSALVPSLAPWRPATAFPRSSRELLLPVPAV